MINPEFMKLKSVLLLSILCIFFNYHAYAGGAIADNQDDLEEIQKKIDILDNEIKKNIKTKEGLSSELKREEKKISKSKKEIYKINRQSKKNQKKLRELEQELKELNEEITDRRANLTDHYYQIYTHGKPGFIQMMIEGDSPHQISREMNYLSYLAVEQNNNILKIKEKYQAIDTNKQETSKTIEKINALKKKQEKKKRLLEKQKKEKDKVLKKIASTIKSQKKEKDKLIEDEKKLTSLIEKLIEKSKIQAQKKTKKESIQADSKYLPDSSLDDVNFIKLKKKLRLPVKGKIIHKYGKKRPDTGIKWKGLFIKANEGDEVYAVAKGKVVFADWLRGFGNLIILDHGDGYMSLYGNNESIIVQQGLIVKGGDVIATVGNSGGNSSNGLYYELRKNSKPFNPLAWTKL
jgi:septal ring factor EnvC (AmiA/AmiB activator)